ncbi:hypothetical protein [Paraburkholderia sp. GAS348]|uniref:hypothetical protein n=1 Tax=Paraburkholderia sp. GAS348 TaxID=3035132 RepID=UPI003D1EAF98
MTPPSLKPEYFEFAELPGVKHFRCDRYNATLSVDACAGMWRDGNHALTEKRMRCKVCPVGAMHAGKLDANPSPLRGLKICARCHATASRLIGRHLCISCYNRQREQLIGKNAKGTKPVKLAPLQRRTVSYMAGGKLKTKTVDRSLDATEVIIAVLRDEEDSVRFRWQPPAKLQALL